MIEKFSDWEWCGVETKVYKDNPGSWESVIRKELMAGAQTAFQVRYFEVAPGGYTSFERHNHEHNVVVVRGRGIAILNQEMHEVGPFDTVRVAGQVAHQFRNPYQEPLGILCIVDRERDKPELADPSENPYTSE